MSLYIPVQDPNGPLVTTLPTGYDGQIVNLQTTAMATDGIVWRFRYNAASGSSYKWEFVGGTPWSKQENAAENTASAALVDLATPGPQFASELLAGEYLLTSICWAGNATATNTSVIIGIDNAGSDTNVSRGNLHTSNYYLTLSDTTEFTVAASTTVKMQYSSSAATSVQFSNRRLIATPIRLA